MIIILKSRKKVVAFDSQQKTEIKKTSKIDEISGKLAINATENKLMHSVLENDKKTIDEGKLVNESINHGFGSFNADLMFESMVNNYALAKSLYGETIIRMVSDYDPDYVKKNVRIPEFRKELKQRIEKNIDKLTEDDIINKSGSVTEKGFELASLIMYIEELDRITAQGFVGTAFQRKASAYGDKYEQKLFRKGDRYRDVSIRKSIRTAVRRGHDSVNVSDLSSFERKRRGNVSIIYALDASSSMKGDKIATCKKAGIALAYSAIESKDKVGLIVFGSDIREAVPPTKDFDMLLKTITRIRASRQTNIKKTIDKAIELFGDAKGTKHLILLTDAMPTVGDEPQSETLKAVSNALSNNVTISIVGIQLSRDGEKLAEKMVGIGEGRLYSVKKLDEIDKLVLCDYYSVV